MQRRFFREKEWKGEIGRRLGAKTNIYVNGCQWQKQGLHQPLCLPTYYIAVRHREENYTLTRHAESFKTFIFALCPGEHEDSLKHGSVHCSVPSVMPSQSRQPYSWRNPNAILWESSEGSLNVADSQWYCCRLQERGVPVSVCISVCTLHGWMNASRHSDH